MRAGDI